MRKISHIQLGAITCFGFLLSAACQIQRQEEGPVQNTKVSLDKGSVDHAYVELNIGSGELNLQSGTRQLMDGKFEFNVPDLKPKVRSSIDGSHATVTVNQPKGTHTFGQQRNIWTLQLNDKVVMDLNLNCGAGQARLDLGHLNLRDVKVHMGAGQIDLNLEGYPSRDYDVSISGGVGEATIHLPHDVGVRAEARGGLGSITVTGLEKKNGAWENSLYDNAKVNVRLEVQGGIGEIRIIG